MWRSVYFPRSAVMPTISGRSAASAASACPNGAALVRWPSPAIEAIIADVVSRGLPSSDPSPCSATRFGRTYFERFIASPSISALGCGLEQVERLLPFVRLDADEMRLLASLEEWHALGELRVANDDVRLPTPGPRRVESCHQCVDIVSIDALHVPPERLELRVEGLEVEHLRRHAVGLHLVDVDQRDEIVELPMAGRHRRFPREPLVQLAVRVHYIDERLRLLSLQCEAVADRNAETVAKRAAADFHSRCIRR